MKRLIIALSVAVIVLAVAVLYLVRKTNRIERAMKPRIHLIASSVR